MELVVKPIWEVTFAEDRACNNRGNAHPVKKHANLKTMKRFLKLVWYLLTPLCWTWMCAGLIWFEFLEVRGVSDLNRRLDRLIQADASRPKLPTTVLAAAEDPDPDVIPTNALWITNMFSTNIYTHIWTNYSMLHPEVMVIKPEDFVTTTWVGKIIVGKNSPDTPERYKNSTARILEFELGLRSDGMVVWREAAK